jgi:hypothetical protein
MAQVQRQSGHPETGWRLAARQIRVALRNPARLDSPGRCCRARKRSGFSVGRDGHQGRDAARRRRTGSGASRPARPSVELPVSEVRHKHGFAAVRAISTAAPPGAIRPPSLIMRGCPGEDLEDRTVISMKRTGGHASRRPGYVPGVAGDPVRSPGIQPPTSPAKCVPSSSRIR